MIVAILLIVALLITLREGYQQADKYKHSKILSDIWHGLGFTMRLAVFVLIYLTGAKLIILIIAALLMWPIYNIACNIGRRQKWYYLSNKGIDKVLRKVFFFVNFDN